VNRTDGLPSAFNSPSEFRSNGGIPPAFPRFSVWTPPLDPISLAMTSSIVLSVVNCFFAMMRCPGRSAFFSAALPYFGSDAAQLAFGGTVPSVAAAHAGQVRKFQQSAKVEPPSRAEANYCNGNNNAQSGLEL
jgi:hypothetical protein